MSQVHKENLTAVDNALPNRVGLEIEIFGMEGIPDEIVQQHQQRVLTQYHQSEAERRAATGNAAAGAPTGNAPKKPKTEDISDLKKRLAEHKAAKLAAEQNGGSSGSATPTGAGQAQLPDQQQPAYMAGSPSYPHYQQPYAPPPSTTTFGQPQSYSTPPPQPGYQAPGYGQPPNQPYGQTAYGQHPQPPFQQAPPYTPQFTPPPFPHQGPYPGQQHPPHLVPNGTSPFPGQPAGLPRPFPAASPATGFQPQHRTQSPSQNGLPQRTGSGSLPSASGLPQRPAVGAPPVNAFQFQQMHQGQIPVAPSHTVPQNVHNGPPGLQNGVSTSPPTQTSEAPNAASIDDLISSASKQADANAVDTSKSIGQQATAPASTSAPTETATKEDTAEEKSTKKDKDKAKQTRLVYSDNEVSPEEKMAMLPKYAFTPSKTIAV